MTFGIFNVQSNICLKDENTAWFSFIEYVLLQKNTGYDIIKKIQTFQGELNAINNSNMRR